MVKRKPVHARNKQVVEDRRAPAQLDGSLEISIVSAEMPDGGHQAKVETFSFSAAPKRSGSTPLVPDELARVKRPAVSCAPQAAPLRVTSNGSIEASDSFRAAVEANWTAIYRYLYCLTGNPHDTEDLTQETFLRALRRWESFKQGTNMRAWLLRIGTNAFFDIQRKKRTLKIGPLGEEIESQAKSAEDSLSDREQGALILAALQDLLEVTRMVFHLRVTKDMAFKEIAKLAGISEVAARQHMHLARTKLLKRFGGRLK